MSTIADAAAAARAAVEAAAEQARQQAAADLTAEARKRLDDWSGKRLDTATLTVADVDAAGRKVVVTDGTTFLAVRDRTVQTVVQAEDGTWQASSSPLDDLAALGVLLADR